VAAVASGLALGVGLGVGYNVVSGLARTAAIWAKWKAIPEDMKMNLIAKALQSIIGEEKDAVTGMSTHGQVKAIIDFISKTLDMAVMVDEAIASQLFVQMIQQSIAYAIYTSHAGAIGTVCNVYSGGMYLPGQMANTIGENIDRVDRRARAFLAAETGLNVTTLGYELMRGARRRIEDVCRRLLQDLDRLQQEWNDTVWRLYTMYMSMAYERLRRALELKEDAVQRAYRLLEAAVEEYLSRVTEELDTLEACKAWFDAGLISEEELDGIALRIQLEVEASRANFEEAVQDVQQAVEDGVEEWDRIISDAFQDLKTAFTRFAVAIRRVFDDVFLEVLTFAEYIVREVYNTVEDVCAYRNIPPPLTVFLETTETLEPEYAGEEVNRLYMRRWMPMTYTVVYPHQTLRGRGFEQEDAYPPQKAWVELPCVALGQQPQPTPWYRVYNRLKCGGWTTV